MIKTFIASFKTSIFLLCALHLIRAALSLSEVNENCVAAANGTTSNDYLIGTWYRVYQFELFGPVPPHVCPVLTFSKPTAAELQEYRDKFSSSDLPHPISENSIKYRFDYTRGLLSGDSEVKTFLWAPDIVLHLYPDVYEMYVFKRLNDKFALYWKCHLRGHIKWLISRDRNATHEEKQEIIKNRPEIKNMFIEKYCSVPGA